MLLTADWVVPVSGPPIHNGAVHVRGSRIAAVGPLGELIRDHPDDPLHEYPGATIVPGLVNAHTHLALTCMKGLIPSQPFDEWISHVPGAMAALNSDDLAASTVYGAILSIVSGVTVVGDIAYGPESVDIAADTGLGGAFYWEVFGITRDELPSRLRDLEYPGDPGRVRGDRLRCGISPHAPYTSGPGLLTAAYATARDQGAAFAVHAAESDAEARLLLDGTGPFAGLAASMAPDFEPPGTGSISYLDELGILENAVAIHCVKVLPAELPLLARTAAGVVVCPRSNVYLQNGSVPVRRMLDEGVTVGIGTDSLASNTDLDLMAEVRALRDVEPSITHEEALEMMTIRGAEVLGLDTHFGTLETGKQADVAVYRTTGDDPVVSLVENADRSTVEAVMSGGVFRVLDGSPVVAVSPVERASHMARQKAAIAIESGGMHYQ